MLFWNNALWLDVASHMTIFNQTEWVISAQHRYALLKLVNDMESRLIKISKSMTEELVFYNINVSMAWKTNLLRSK